MIAMCRVLDVSESGFYSWRKRPTCQRHREDTRLTQEIHQVFDQHQGRYGSPRKRGKLKSWQDHDYVFCTSFGTHLHPDKDIRASFKRLLQKAELPDIRFYDLRHSTASLLFSEGIYPKIVQEILGHSNIRITLDIYSHMLPTIQDGAMGRLDDLLGE